MLKRYFNKQLCLWALYDFANSIPAIMVAFYFSPFIVRELKLSDFYVSMPTMLATLLLILCLPYLGAQSDRLKRRMPFLIICTVMAVIGLLILAFSAQAALSWNLSLLTLIVVLLAFGIYQFFYQAAMAFYLAFISNLSESTPRNWVASFGLSVGALGNLLALLLAMPLAAGGLYFLGLEGTPLIFFLSGVLFLLVALPFFIYFKEIHSRTNSLEGAFFAHNLRELWQVLISLREEKNVLIYLCAYYLFADAIMTLNIFLSLYLEQVLNFTVSQKTITFVVGLIFGIIGALFTPLYIKRFSSEKQAILAILLFWSLSLLALALTNSLLMTYIIMVLNGLAFGILFSISRIMYSKLIPQTQSAKYFGIYVLFERFASFLGPLLWSVVIAIFTFFNSVNAYRFAMLSLAILVLIAFFIMKKVKENYQASN